MRWRRGCPHPRARKGQRATKSKAAPGRAHAHGHVKLTWLPAARVRTPAPPFRCRLLLLDRLDCDLDPDLVADLTDRLERTVERNAVVLTVDRARGEECRAHLAPRIFEATLVRADESDGLRA